VAPRRYAVLLPSQGEGLTAPLPVQRGSRRDEGRPEINATPAARRTKGGSSIFTRA
jgi:hypothetical protein